MCIRDRLDPVDSEQHDEIATTVEQMVANAVDNGFPVDKLTELQKIVSDYIDIFRVTFSSDPPADFPPLLIDLHPTVKPIRVRLRNYSQAQRDFTAPQGTVL